MIPNSQNQNNKASNATNFPISQGNIVNKNFPTKFANLQNLNSNSFSLSSNQQVQNSQIQNNSTNSQQTIPNASVQIPNVRTILDQLFQDKKIGETEYRHAQDEIFKNAVPEEFYIKDHNLADETDITIAKSKVYQIPYINLHDIEIDKSIVTKIDVDLARSQIILAFALVPNLLDPNAIGSENSKETLKVAMVDPLDQQKVRFIEAMTNKNIVPYIAEESVIRSVIESKYSNDTLIKQDVGKALEDVKENIVQLQEELLSEQSLITNVQNAPIARIVSMILEYGVKFKASDCHIEPREKNLSVRFRIHGILMEKLELPLQITNAVVSRIKILSDLKIDEHRVPQDGRFEAQFGKVRVDLRVSIMPTVYGEKIVLRFLDKTSGVFPLEETGLRGTAYKIYKEALSKTQGIILVTGPTGSGKTVTLSSSLAILNKPEVNIVTLEDPVEVRIDGVNQVQVNPEVGLTFASGLRSFLRQDPDVIMVGEIRDEETAQLATQAALVGRLVLATLHTNSASGAIPRLLNMNIEPFLLASTINLILAQRLPRRICSNCKVSYEATNEQVKKIHEILAGIKGYDNWNQGVQRTVPSENGTVTKEEKLKLFKGKGCEKCNDTGYAGRIGIFEVMKVDEKLSKLIIEHRTAAEIEQVAKENGMVTMLQDGFMKALDGITTFEEVLRVQN